MEHTKANCLVRQELRTGGCPPILGLVHLEERYYQSAKKWTRQFLNGNNLRIIPLFQQFPYSSAWLIAKTLREVYGVNSRAVYQPIEEAFQVELPQGGNIRQTLYEEFTRVCRSLALSIPRNGRRVDAYHTQAGISQSLLHHVIVAFLRQERAFGPAPYENSATLNGWEDDALQFLPEGVVTPCKVLEADETGYHAELFARLRRIPDDTTEIPFEKSFAQVLKDTLDRTNGVTGMAVGAFPKPKLLWRNGSMVLSIPRVEGSVKFWIGDGGPTLHLRGGDEWVLPQPWPEHMHWQFDEHSGEIPFLASNGEFAAFDLGTGRLVKVSIDETDCLEIDAIDVVILARSKFVLGAENATNIEENSWVAYGRLGLKPLSMSILSRKVNLRSRTRRRIVLLSGVIVSGPHGRLVGPNVKFKIETGITEKSKRWVRIDIGNRTFGQELNFDAEGSADLELKEIISPINDNCLLEPQRLRIRLMAPGVSDLEHGATSGVTFSDWIWPGFRTIINGMVFECNNAHSNLMVDKSRHIFLDNQKRICLDKNGGYLSARMVFDIGGETVPFDVPWPDVTLERVRGDGKSDFMPYGSKLIIRENDRFDTVVISCPDKEASLCVRGVLEKYPFYNGLRRSLSLRDLGEPASEDHVTLNESNGASRLLFRVVSTTSPESFNIGETLGHIIIKFRLPVRIDAVQLEISDETGTDAIFELQLGYRPVDTRLPNWLSGYISGNDVHSIVIDINSRDFDGRFSLAKISVREVGQNEWNPLRTSQGSIYAIAIRSCIDDDLALLRASEIAVRFKNLSFWMSDCYAEPAWDFIRRSLITKWKDAGLILFKIPVGRTSIIRDAILQSSDNASPKWIPLAHPIQIIPELYSTDPYHFQVLASGKMPGDKELAYIYDIWSKRLREIKKLHGIVFVAFDNSKEAEQRNVKLQGFDTERFFSNVAHPMFDTDSSAGWFWNGEPLLGPGHWRAVHRCFIERLEQFGLFQDQHEEEHNFQRTMSLQRFINQCWVNASIRPPVPKRQLTDQEPHNIDIWIFAAISEFARASRHDRVQDFVEKVAQSLGKPADRVLEDISLLLRLAPEAFAYFMLIWEIEKARS